MFVRFKGDHILRRHLAMKRICRRKPLQQLMSCGDEVLSASIARDETVKEKRVRQPWGGKVAQGVILVLYHRNRRGGRNPPWRVLLALTWGLSQAVFAHPHSFIDMKTEIISRDNYLSGFKMTWTMDEITSADVFYDDAGAKPDSVAWKKLAAQVMANVLGQHYFTEVYRDGQRVKFEDMPAEYHLYRNGQKAVLMFVLPLAHPPLLAGSPIFFSTYDPTYFVDMTYHDETAITLPAGLSAGCKLTLMTPKPNPSLQAYALSLDNPGSKGVDTSLGKQFAQRVQLQCH